MLYVIINIYPVFYLTLSNLRRSRYIYISITQRDYRNKNYVAYTSSVESQMGVIAIDFVQR